MEEREFLTRWLLESGPLLGDELDRENLTRMTIAELWELAEERQETLRVTGEAKLQEAEEMKRYVRYRKAGIRGVVKGGK